MGAVTVLSNQLLLLTDRCAVLTALPPVPLLSKMMFRARAALSWAIGIAVTPDSRAWWALVTQMQLKAVWVTVLVLAWQGIMDGPGNGAREEHV